MLMITFICGLDDALGQDLIEVIKERTASSTVTTAQCPGFSRFAWIYEGTMDQELYQYKLATETMPFILDCCLEMTNVASNIEFPSKNKRSNKNKPPMSCQPQINLNVISLDKTVELLRHNAIVFSPDPTVMLHNLHVDYDNVHMVEYLVSKIDIAETGHIQVSGYKSDIPEGIISRLVSRVNDLNIIEIMNSKPHTSDMKGLLQHLDTSPTRSQSMTMLYFECVTLRGCEATLCTAISKLWSLRELSMRGQALAGHEAQLCTAISRLHQLLLLNLSRTDLSAAGGALPACLHSLPHLRRLGLYGCKLGSGQVSQVCQLLPACCAGMLLFNIGINTCNDSLASVLSQFNKLSSLQYFSLPLGNLLSKHEVIIAFTNIPGSIVFLEIAGLSINDEIRCLVELLATKPRLRYLYINGAGVRQHVVAELRQACHTRGILLMTSYEERMKHHAGITALQGEIRNKIRALY